MPPVPNSRDPVVPASTAQPYSRPSPLNPTTRSPSSGSGDLNAAGMAPSASRASGHSSMFSYSTPSSGSSHEDSSHHHPHPNGGSGTASSRYSVVANAPLRRPGGKTRDSYADTYGSPSSAAGPDVGSLNAIAAGRVGASYGPFPAELTTAGLGTFSNGSGSGTGSFNSLSQAAGASRHSLAAFGAYSDRPASSSMNKRHTIGSLSGQSDADLAQMPEANYFSSSRRSRGPFAGMAAGGGPRDSFMSTGSGGWEAESDAGGVYSERFAETTDNLLWKEENKEPDDFLHDPDPVLDRRLDRKVSFWSKRGWMNVVSLGVLIAGLISLFALWPVITYFVHRTADGPGWNLGGVNASGQVPDIPNLPTLIDKDTPQNAKSRVGSDGKEYELVFSDEFNKDGRTFWHGDDPFWEAVDLHYWQTTNLEWYDPDAITTNNGNLEIELSMEPVHNLSFRSGMLQSWNQFCFTEGYIEVNISLPGSPDATGMWPGAWTMGNLARAGFGATNDGLWPYSYGSCDVGTLPNQTYPNGSVPVAAKTSGIRDYGGELSWLPGQRVSACTCESDKDEHPGPHPSVGRSGPEIDIIEAQYGYGPSGNLGSASQSLQIAPMDAGYYWNNVTGDGIVIHDGAAVNTRADSGTIINTWHGSINQESLSGITITDGTSYGGRGYQTFGFEYKRGYSKDGAYITWYYNGQPTWTVNAAAIRGNVDTMISDRPVSMEPMYIILNLGLSGKFQTVEWTKLEFPAKYLVDYVRVYQRKGQTNYGCSPDDYPTEDYINNHMIPYRDADLTRWTDAKYPWPKNSLKDTC